MKTRIPIIVILLFCSGRLCAQEVQVPIDSAGKVFVVTEELETNLHLFPSYPNFHEARLFKQNDSAYILEITSLDNGKLIRNREPKTLAEVITLQKDFAETSRERSPIIFYDQSSRSKFLVWETLISSFVYAPLLLAAVNSSDAGTIISLELLIGGLGYFIPSLLTNHSPMNDGESSLALGGAFLGLGHGVMLARLLKNGSTGNEIFAYAGIASIIETGIGYVAARSSNMSEGTADVVRYGGLFGGLQGTGLSVLIDNNPSASLVSGMTLLGSAAGFAAGSALARSEDYTRGNASVVLTTGLYGSILFPFLYASLSNSIPDLIRFRQTVSFRALVASGMIGNLCGIYVANSLMRSRKYSAAEGNNIILGTTGGFVLGFGIGEIISPKATGGNTSIGAALKFVLPVIIGTAGGFALMMHSMGKGKGGIMDTGWDMNLNPGSLLGVLIPSKNSMANSYIPPALTLQYKW